jgi:hypothetical protein
VEGEINGAFGEVAFITLRRAHIGEQDCEQQVADYASKDDKLFAPHCGRSIQW